MCAFCFAFFLGIFARRAIHFINARADTTLVGNYYELMILVCVCVRARCFQVHRNNYTNTMYCKFKTKRLHTALTHPQSHRAYGRQSGRWQRRRNVNVNWMKLKCLAICHICDGFSCFSEYRHWRYVESLFAPPLSTATAIFYHILHSWNKWISLNVWKMSVRFCVWARACQACRTVHWRQECVEHLLN